MKEDKLALRYLTSNNQMELRYETMKIGNRIYTSTLNTINNYYLDKWKGNLYI